MKVLWVTPQCPHPAWGGGSAHEYTLLQHVSARHDVRVVSSYTGGTRDEHALAALGIDVIGVKSVARPYPTNKYAVGRALVRARPTLMLWTLRERWRDVQRVVDGIERSWRPDLVHVSLGEMAPALAHVRVPSTLLLFDSYVRHAVTRLPLEPMPRRRLQLRVERLRASRWEREWYAKATKVAAVSEVDAAHLRAQLHRDVEVIENPIADEYFEVARTERRPDTVTFVGSLHYPPNADAVEWLARDIWPEVRRQRPSARLVVAGRTDGDTQFVPHLRAAVEAAGGEIHTDVRDVRPYYWEAAAVVSPVRAGSGLRNKVLHAMACGAPVVATPAALEGIAVVPDDEVLVGATASELAAAIVRTLDDPSAAAARAARATRAMARYRADVIAARFERWWQSALLASAAATR